MAKKPKKTTRAKKPKTVQLPLEKARRGDRKPSYSQIYRWSSKGLRGVRLETIDVGGKRCTSLEAMQRFFNAITPVRLPPHSETMPLPLGRYE